MSEHDELARLRGADPVDPTTIPSAEDPAAVALRKGIVMGETEPTGTCSRTPMIAAAAAAVLLVASAGIVLATRGTDQPAPGPGPIIPPGAASCVENYSLDTLKNREVAFDGTVASVSDDEATFTVNEWFRGGSASEITLEGASTLGGITSAGPSVSMEPGTRLLVAGDGGFAWSCGFTQPYDADVASQWKNALRAATEL